MKKNKIKEDKPFFWYPDREVKHDEESSNDQKFAWDEACVLL